MKAYSVETERFIKEYVLGELGFSCVCEENIAEIVDYIVERYEVPLAQAQESGDKIDENLLKLATDAVTEITSREDW